MQYTVEEANRFHCMGRRTAAKTSSAGMSLASPRSYFAMRSAIAPGLDQRPAAPREIVIVDRPGCLTRGSDALKRVLIHSSLLTPSGGVVCAAG